MEEYKRKMNNEPMSNSLTIFSQQHEGESMGDLILLEAMLYKMATQLSEMFEEIKVEELSGASLCLYKIEAINVEFVKEIKKTREALEEVRCFRSRKVYQISEDQHP